jgi:hypothetical protein
MDFFVWENVVLNLKDLVFCKVLEEKIHHVVPPSPLLVQIIGLFIFYVFINFFQFVAHNLESKLNCCGKQQSSFHNSHNHLFFLGDEWQNLNVNGKLFVCCSYATFYIYY